MNWDQASRRIAILDEWPLSEVECCIDSCLKLNLRPHPALFRLRAQVVSVERVTFRDRHDFEYAVDVFSELCLPRVGAVPDGIVEAALTLLGQVVTRCVVVPACIARIGHRARVGREDLTEVTTDFLD